jgi:hypothetical protein
MAENKTKPATKTVAAYVDSLTDETRKADAKILVKLMQQVTGEKPVLWGTAIIGFGSHHYRHDSGREGDVPLAGFSPRKAATTLYGMTSFEGADELLKKLGKYKLDGSCLHIKRLADVDLKVLEGLISGAVANRRASG